MAVGQYTITSGTNELTEQDVLNRLDEFMVGGLGWNRIDVVADSASDNDRVWYSEGEVPGKYMPLYFRARANNDDLIFSTYSNWNVDTQTGYDGISNATEIQIPYQGGNDSYMFCGNKDVVFVSTYLDSTGSSYLGGCGYWDTFYTPTQDPLPAFVFGQNSNADTFANTARVRSYGYDRYGFLESVSTYSGSNVVYVAQDRHFLATLASPNVRDNRNMMFKQDFYTQRSRTDGGIPGPLAHEQRGEIPGLYQFDGDDFVSHTRLVASGIATNGGVPGNQLGVGDFIVLKSTATNSYAIGPLVDWDPVPLTINNAELWLKGDAVARRGGGDQQGGRVRDWHDLSQAANEATQATEADQPNPVSSGTNFNGHAVVSFDGSDHLTGSLSYVNDYTVFVVADYTVGPSRRPLFYTRGDVGGDDTYLALEFNTTVSGSAEVSVRSDDSPAAEDVVRYTGLVEDTAYILSAVVSGTTTALYVNGDSAGASTITNTKTTTAGNTELNYGIGTTLDAAGAVSATAKHDGNIAEVLVYARDLTVEEHQSIVCYLGDKYGITVSGTCG
jgi:hypothetical protein